LSHPVDAAVTSRRAFDVAEATPTSRQLEDLTAELRRVDAAGRRLDRAQVRVWFQNRRRERRQLALDLSSAAAAADVAPSGSASSYPAARRPAPSLDEFVVQGCRGRRQDESIVDGCRGRRSQQLEIRSSASHLYSSVVDSVTSDVSCGRRWSSCGQRPSSGGDYKVVEAVRRLARYCNDNNNSNNSHNDDSTPPTDITNTMHCSRYRPPPPRSGCSVYDISRGEVLVSTSK